MSPIWRNWADLLDVCCVDCHLPIDYLHLELIEPVQQARQEHLFRVTLFKGGNDHFGGLQSGSRFILRMFQIVGQRWFWWLSFNYWLLTPITYQAAQLAFARQLKSSFQVKTSFETLHNFASCATTEPIVGKSIATRARWACSSSTRNAAGSLPRSCPVWKGRVGRSFWISVKQSLNWIHTYM